MTPADLARLELAKRAYKATLPSVAEVQTGVRRARLALPRPRARRSWFSKGLVFVVLAVGSLAYAKPHALTDLVGDMLPRDRGNAKGEHKSGASAAVPPEVANAPAALTRGAASRASALQPQPATPALQPPATPAPELQRKAVSTSNGASTHGATKADQGALPSRSRAKSAAAGAVEKTHDAVASNTVATNAGNDATNDADGSDAESARLSNWGRVGQALAHGDEASALTVLDQLSQSADMRTRDKADLGRAQLLMAQGNREAACSLARSLTHRRAGGRIERQALALLKSCEP